MPLSLVFSGTDQNAGSHLHYGDVQAGGVPVPAREAFPNGLLHQLGSGAASQESRCSGQQETSRGKQPMARILALSACTHDLNTKIGLVRMLHTKLPAPCQTC